MFFLIRVERRGGGFSVDDGCGVMFFLTRVERRGGGFSVNDLVLAFLAGRRVEDDAFSVRSVSSMLLFDEDDAADDERMIEQTVQEKVM